MGLFAKVLGKEAAAVSLNKQEAFAAVALAAIAADGDISEEEVQSTAIDLALVRLFRSYNLRDLTNTLNKVAGVIKRRGTGPALQAVKAALSRADSAFFVAADLVVADGVVEEGEGRRNTRRSSKLPSR